MIFTLVFVVGVILFFFKEKIALPLLTILLVMWFVMQIMIYFRSDFTSYYEFFSNTHRMFKTSELILVKDTYHMILDVLISLALVLDISYIFTKKQNRID